MSTVQVVAFLASVSASASLAQAGKPPAEPELPEVRVPKPAAKSARPAAVVSKATKPVAKPATKPATKPVAKTEAKADPKTEAKPAAKHLPQARIASPNREAGPRRAKPIWPAVELFAANLNERLQFRPYDTLGRIRKTAGSELARILRCWHTGKSHKIDPRLGRALYEVARHFPGHRVEIFSGYRPKAYCTRAHSRHLTGAAIDFRVAGVKNEALINWLRSNFHPAGVGYYPNGVHVHLDLDRSVDTYWVDRGDVPTLEPAAPSLPPVGQSAPMAAPTVAHDLEATTDEAHGEPVVALPDDPGVDAPPQPELELLGEPPMDDPALTF